MSEHEKMLYWLIDCESATLEHLAGLKSPPKSELRRHKGICAHVQHMISTGCFVERPSEPGWVMKRLNDAVEKAERKLEGKQ